MGISKIKGQIKETTGKLTGDKTFEAEGKIIRTMLLDDKDSQSRGVVVSLRIDDQLYDRIRRYVELRREAIAREFSDDDSPSGAVGDKAVSD